MGVFSSIKKAVKSVFKGIKKVFTSVVEGVSKFMDSDIGKAIMLAAAVYTGGLAIAGGVQGWSAAAANGAGFMGKFVAGAEGFMTVLFNPIDATNALMETGAPLTAGQLSAISPSVATDAANAVSQLATATPESTAIADAAQGVVSTAPGPPSQLPSIGGPGAMPDIAKTATTVAKTATDAEAGGGWLSKAAGFAKDFLLSPTGASMIEGYAMGGAAEEQQKFDDRIRQQWMDPDNAMQKQLKGEGMLSGTINRGTSPVFGGTYGGGGVASTSGAMPGEPILARS